MVIYLVQKYTGDHVETLKYYFNYNNAMNMLTRLYKHDGPEHTSSGFEAPKYSIEFVEMSDEMKEDVSSNEFDEVDVAAFNK